jgi:uncharacterized Zn finger protein (UPF0148 family)
MSGKIHWIDSKAYCHKCGKLTKLNADKEGRILCPFCKADLLRWFLKETGLSRATGEPRSASSTRKPPQAGEDTVSANKTEEEAHSEGV